MSRERAVMSRERAVMVARRNRIVLMVLVFAAVMGIFIGLLAVAGHDDARQDCVDAGGVPVNVSGGGMACVDAGAVKFGAQ